MQRLIFILLIRLNQYLTMALSGVGFLCIMRALSNKTLVTAVYLFGPLGAPGC
jgi:hypothetical protein